MAGKALKCLERIMDKFVNNTPKVVYQKESIDYDKLADAIVRAEKRVRQEERAEQERIEKDLVEKSKYMRNTFAMRASWILYLLFALEMLFGVIVLLSVVKAAIDTTWSLSIQSFINGVFYGCGVIFATVIILLAVLWKKAAKEIDMETDRNYVATVFSGLMAALAVIVAIISLFITK